MLNWWEGIEKKLLDRHLMMPFHYSLVYILDIFFWWFFSRSKSAVDVTSEFVDMYIEVPVEEWGKQLEAADIPNLRYIPIS